jgi:undecaprenyl-diphosphatase
MIKKMLDTFNKKKFLTILIGITILRLVVGSYLNLSDDEAYYLLWSRNLGMSYYDHPPVIAYLIRIMTTIFGENNFSVRLVAIGCTTITSLYIYKISYYLYKDERIAGITGIIFNILPLYTFLSIMTLPDSPLILLYTMVLYYFLKVVYEKDEKAWYFIAILTGLGLLSKYNMFMVYPSIFFYLLFSRENRFWLLKKEPYVAFLISILMFTPVIYWNYSHNWGSFEFHLEGRQSKTFRFRPTKFFQFVGGQIGVVSPILFFGIFIASIKNFKKPDVNLLFWFALPLIGIFTFSSLSNNSKVHWLACAYIPMIIVFVKYTEFNKLWRAGIILSGSLSLLLYFLATTLIVPLEPKKNALADMQGWNLAGERVQEIYDESTKNGDEWFLFGERYQTSSQLAAYLPKKEYVYNLSGGTSQFDYWRDRKELIGKNGIFVATSFYNKKPEDKFLFDRAELVDTVVFKRWGRVQREYFIYKIYNYKGRK